MEFAKNWAKAGYVQFTAEAFVFCVGGGKVCLAFLVRGGGGGNLVCLEKLRRVTRKHPAGESDTAKTQMANCCPSQ